ncbi:MAG: hypothetical protein IRY91_04915 [Gemmatimonadaceae bacterium]|nr:hypothetical protein [Gemmatimonadaceae bacterium]
MKKHAAFTPLPGRPRRRRGVALLATVAAIATLGALATGVFFAALRHVRDARNTHLRTRALAAAEYGIYHTIAPAVWSALWSAAPPTGLLATRVYTLIDGVASGAAASGPTPGSRAGALADATDTVWVWKLTTSSALLVSAAVVRSGAVRAARRIALLVALRPTAAPPDTVGADSSRGTTPASEPGIPRGPAWTEM